MDGIAVKGIDYFFGKKQVLWDIALSIPQGQICGLLGPSGCGKSTLVKIMAGILEATSGEADILGQRMPQLSLLKQIGYMAQSDALYTTLTAAENLHFFGALYGMSKGEINARAQQVLAMVDLSDALGKSVQSFSGGMKRRLSLAIALLHTPPVLILDEPTVGIDPLLRRRIWAALNDLAEQGTTIMLTTHVMDEADKCHQLAMMREGRLIAEGTPQALRMASGCASIEEAFIYYGGDSYAG